jgi:hypothetical protein
MYLVSEYKNYFYEAKERVKMWGFFQTLCLIQISFIFYDRICISCVLCSLKSLKIQQNMKFQFRKQVTSKTSFNIACLSSHDFISHLAIYRKIKGRKDTMIFKWNKNWYFSWWNKNSYFTLWSCCQITNVTIENITEHPVMKKKKFLLKVLFVQTKG